MLQKGISAFWKVGHTASLGVGVGCYVQARRDW